jgi:hypothetical protein
MPPDAPQQSPVGADAQRSGHEIAMAVEQGIANKDLSQAIQLIQQTERNLAGKPQDLKSALDVANRELEKSQNPTVQKYFQAHNIEGSDPSKAGLVLSTDQNPGVKVKVGVDGKAYSLEKPNALKEDRILSPDQKTEVIKYTSPDGKQAWEVTRERMQDGKYHPYKIVRPDGSTSRYLWEQTGQGKIEPVGLIENDKDGKPVRQYEMAKDREGKRVPGVWQKLGGPEKDFPFIFGKLELTDNGIHRFRMEGYRGNDGKDVTANQVLTINPDGTMRKEAGQPQQQRAVQPPEGQQRRPRS